MEINELSISKLMLLGTLTGFAIIGIACAAAGLRGWIESYSRNKPTSVNWGNVLESSRFRFPADELDGGKAIRPEKEDPFEEFFCSLILSPDILCSPDITNLIMSESYREATRTAIELLKRDRIKKEEEQELRKFCIDNCGSDMLYDRIEHADKLYNYILNGKVTTAEDSPKTTAP